MEELIARGDFVGVIDFTTGELANELLGAYYAAGPHRMEAAARAGVPQVVVPITATLVTAIPLPSQVSDRWFDGLRPTQSALRSLGQANQVVSMLNKDRSHGHGTEYSILHGLLSHPGPARHQG